MKVRLPSEYQDELRKHGHDKAVKNITPKTHDTMIDLCSNKEVDSEDAFDALFEILGSCATRFGQSMARRYASKGVHDTYLWLRAQATPLTPSAAEAVKKAKIQTEIAESDRDMARALYVELAHGVEQVLLQAETLVISPDQRFFLGLENLLPLNHKEALAAYRKGATRAKKSA